MGGSGASPGFSIGGGAGSGTGGKSPGGLRFLVPGELRFLKTGALPANLESGGIVDPGHDPGIREREFDAAVPFCATAPLRALDTLR